jgi:hypothetical protein
MEPKPVEQQRNEWRERKQRSRANIAAKEEQSELRELASELKKAIKESPDGTVPRWFLAEYGITAALKAIRFLKIVPVPEVPGAVGAPRPDTSGWWIGLSSKGILARLSETNPTMVESLFKNRQPTLEPEEVDNGQV